MSRLTGRDVSFSTSISGTTKVIAFAKSCDITVQGDVQEFTSALSGRGKRFRAGRYSWVINVDALISSPDDPKSILQALINGTAVDVKMGVGSSSNGLLLQGTAVPTSWKLTGSLGSMATFSATFMGDGNLSL